MKHEFKVLINDEDGVFVNADMLEEGLYTTPKPHIYHKATLIGDLVTIAKHEGKTNTMNNLMRCRLDKYSLIKTN